MQTYDVTGRKVGNIELSVNEDAYRAWMACGSMGISRWVHDYKERTTGKRFCTVEEMGDWIAKVRAMELERTGENSEFCHG